MRRRVRNQRIAVSGKSQTLIRPQHFDLAVEYVNAFFVSMHARRDMSARSQSRNACLGVHRSHFAIDQAHALEAITMPGIEYWLRKARRIELADVIVHGEAPIPGRADLSLSLECLT